jgi:hypothetical protein
VGFSEVLEAEMTALRETAPETGFGDALRAFEGALAASPALSPRSSRAPAWAVELGVELPCTMQDLKRAFRRLAFESHPDRPGGSHEAFLRAKDVLDQAVSSIRSASPLGVGRRYGRTHPYDAGQAPTHSTYA